MMLCEKCGFNFLILYPIRNREYLVWVCWECYQKYLEVNNE